MQSIESPPRVPFADEESGVIARAWDNWFRLISKYMPIITRYEQSLNPASVAANTTAEQTFTVSGLTTRDHVTVNKPTHSTGLGIVNCRVSAANTLAITFMNTTAGAIDSPAETYFIVAVRL